MIKVEVYIPESAVPALVDRLDDSGYLKVGHYDHVYVTQPVTGHWRTLEGADPHLGKVGKMSIEAECLLSFTVEDKDPNHLLALIREIHPYEEPVIHLIPLL